MCLVPDGDLFDAISEGRASVVTDRIETFTETGIALASGGELEADLIVTATGLEMVPFGAIRLSVDGSEVDVGATFAYRGCSSAACPTWPSPSATPTSRGRSGPTSRPSTCAGCSRTWTAAATRSARRRDPAITGLPFADLTSGYVLRAVDRFPKQGSHDPWRREQHHAPQPTGRRGAAGASPPSGSGGKPPPAPRSSPPATSPPPRSA